MDSELYCRLCLKHDMWNRPVPIFVDDYPLSTVISSLLGIEVKKNDALPQVICHLCLSKLSLFKEFSKEVRSSADLLNSLISTRNDNHAPNFGKESADVIRPVVELPITTESCTVKRTQAESTKVESSSIIESADNASSTVEISQGNTRNVSSVARKISKSKVKFKKCSRCKYQTISEKRFKVHISKLVGCPICNIKFCTLRSMKIHQKSHKVKKVLSSIKNIDYKISSRVNDDLDVSNDGNNIKYQWCMICDKVFLSDDDFIKHNEAFHSEPKTESEEAERIENVKEQGIVQIPIASDLISSDKNKKPLLTSVLKIITPKIDKICSLKSNDTPHKPIVKYTGSECNEISLLKNKGDTHSTELKRKSHSSVNLFIKNKRKQVETIKTYPCGKCKDEYESREKLRTHTCIPQVEESSEINTSGSNESLSNVSKEIIVNKNASDNENFDKIDNSSEVFDNDNILNLQHIKMELNDSDVLDLSDTSYNNSCRSESPEFQTSAGLYDTKHYYKSPQHNISTHEDNNQRLSIDEAINATIETAGNNINKELISENNELQFSPKKICNECGEMFNSMKKLFHHKRLHKK